MVQLPADSWHGLPRRGEKTRRTKEEVGRQQQGMDRPGVRQVPEGSGEQGKMEKTGCKIICGAPSILTAKGLMMMMMMMMMIMMMIMKYNMSANLIRVIKHLYDKATGAVLFNGSIGD